MLDESHAIISFNSSPVEKFQAAFQCFDGSFGVAIPNHFLCTRWQQ